MRSLSWGQGKRGQEADIRRFSRRLEGKEKEAKEADMRSISSRLEGKEKEAKEAGKTKQKLSKIRSDK